MGKSNKRYTIHAVLFVFAAMFASCFVQAMDESTGKDALVYVATSDAHVKSVERWKIDQMKTLLVLLNNQNGINSQANPLQATMITSQELDLLNNAWDAIASGTFDQFYGQMVGGQGPTPLSISESSLSILIEAAEKVKAQGISSFCLSYVVPSDVQRKVLVPYLIEPIIDSIPLKPLHVLNAQSDFVSGVVFSPDGKNVLVCGLDKNSDKDVFLWDLVKSTFTYLENLGCNLTAAWSPDGKYIVMAGAGEDNLCLFDVATKQSRILIGHSFISRVAFSPNSEFFVTGSLIQGQNNVVVWSVAMREPVMFMEYPGKVHAVAWSPDGKSIATAGRGDVHGLIVWNAETGKPYFAMKAQYGIDAVAWSPDSAYIVAGGMDKELKVLDAKTWNVSISINIKKTSHALAWSLDDRYIASAEDQDLVVWNAKNGEQLKVGKVHSGRIMSIAFSPDGEYIVSGCFSSQNNLILWSLLSREEKEALRSCSFVQAQLLYRLIMTATKGLKLQLESSDLEIFNSLPQIIKNILQDRYGIFLAEPVEVLPSVEMEAPMKCRPNKQGDCVVS